MLRELARRRAKYIDVDGGVNESWRGLFSRGGVGAK